MPSVHRSEPVPVPCEVAWALVADMSRMGEWVAPLRRVDLLPEGPAGVGVVRRIHPKGLPVTMEERIVEWEEGRRYAYRLVKEPWPFHDYLSTVWVEPEAGGCRIHWAARWEMAPGAAARLATGLVTRVMDTFYGRALRRARARLSG